MAQFKRDDNGVPITGILASVAEVNGAASGGLQILASAGTGKKNRIYKIVLTSSAAETLTISDGFGVHYCAIGVPIVLDYGALGKLQGTAATAITVTSGAAANVGVLVLYTQE